MPAEGAVRGDHQHCIVVVGGDAPDPATLASVTLPPEAIVIAADSGVDHALAAGLHVDIAIGDFDSVSVDGLDAVVAAGARIERHPAAKDHTDLELAMDEALATGAPEVIVLGGDGGRRDHLFANFLVLASPRYASRSITAYLGRSRMYVLHGGGAGAHLVGGAGELVSLLPVHGAAEGVRTDGLRYPLHGETLPAGTTRGVSNVVETSPAEVRLDAGTLVVVLPGEKDGGEA
jgi:thiamine pyrophosphokinase